MGFKGPSVQLLRFVLHFLQVMMKIKRREMKHEVMLRRRRETTKGGRYSWRW